MFQKIPSRERNTTLFQELKKEFSPHVEAADAKTKVFMDRHAKIIFCLMILLIVASFILVFFVLSPEKNIHAENLKKELNAIPEGFGGEFSAMQDLSSRAIKIAELKAEIEGILSLESISGEDSVFLEKAIEELQYFNHNSKEDEY